MMFEHDYKNYPELTNAQIADFGFSSPHKQITEDFFADVVKVHDGDTITVTTESRDFQFPIRLLNIDSPEMNNGGEIAKEWLQNKILGKRVLIQIDPNQRVGKYGRLLGLILHQGLDVGQEELHLGYAKPFGQKREGEVPDYHQVFLIKKWV